MPRGRRFRHWSDVVGWVGRETSCTPAVAADVAQVLFVEGWRARSRQVDAALANLLGDAGRLQNSVDPRNPDHWAP